MGTSPGETERRSASAGGGRLPVSSFGDSAATAFGGGVGFASMISIMKPGLEASLHL